MPSARLVLYMTLVIKKRVDDPSDNETCCAEVRHGMPVTSADDAPKRASELQTSKSGAHAFLGLLEGALEGESRQERAPTSIRFRVAAYYEFCVWICVAVRSDIVY